MLKWLRAPTFLQAILDREVSAFQKFWQKAEALSTGKAPDLDSLANKELFFNRKTRRRIQPFELRRKKEKWISSNVIRYVLNPKGMTLTKPDGAVCGLRHVMIVGHTDDSPSEKEDADQVGAGSQEDPQDDDSESSCAPDHIPQDMPTKPPDADAEMPCDHHAIDSVEEEDMCGSMWWFFSACGRRYIIIFSGG